jgi:hypothetical protein
VAAAGIAAQDQQLCLTSLQRRLVKTGGRRIKHARYHWLLLAESYLTRRLFGAMVGRVAASPVPAGERNRLWQPRNRSPASPARQQCLKETLPEAVETCFQEPGRAVGSRWDNLGTKREMEGFAGRRMGVYSGPLDGQNSKSGVSRT